ncbi:MAG: phosphoribosylformylglycinamidine synthase subunit PurL [bacterium]|nr:phosphoribosylformylglycinamidine synthase subunit PurL [bacterium]
MRVRDAVGRRGSAPEEPESAAATGVLTRIGVRTADHPTERRIPAAAAQLGVRGLEACRFWTVYHLEGLLSDADVARLCAEVLVDPVTDTVIVGEPDGAAWAVEVAPLAGVTDGAARELERAAAVLGVPPLRAATARRYELSGDLDEADIAVLEARLLVNPTIERSERGELGPSFSPTWEAEPAAPPVPLLGLDDGQLAELSRQRMLSLDVTEMRAIQGHFNSCGRDPSDAELQTLAQAWSEHCVHKTFKAEIHLTHTRADGRVELSHHDGLLDALRRATAELDGDWLRSVFVDNAGIIAFDDELDLAVKVETHNHPSALEPFGGANTGVGGVVRDILGVSARPIACTDVLCFGPEDLEEADLPVGVLHPRRIRDGVVAGIGDYGNKLGLPTVNGAVLYDRGYIGNPLVFCGAVGLLPAGSHPTEPRAGDRIIVIGGRTGRDGIGGATFSSAGLDATVVGRAGSAVQIGDPIVEKGCIEVVERARDQGLYNAITDCGAGGLSSAVGEMGAELGAEVDLATVPLKYPGLAPWEIWLSEAQERMVLAVPAARVAPLRELCRTWHTGLSDIGSFTSSGRLVVRHGDCDVIDLPMDLLHDGLPGRTLTATHRDRAAPARPVGPPVAIDSEKLLLDLLAHPNVASRESIIRSYDHEVRGGTVVRPFAGPGADGPTDAAVLKPLGTWHHDKAVALAVGLNPRLTPLDPWVMALHAIDEAFRNLIAVGADPDRVALLDNFSWGDPTRPDRLGSLVRAVQGCVEGARRYRAPFVSGKDSLYNEFDGQAVLGTLLISAVGVVPDLHRVATSALTACGSDLWLVGHGSDRLGGSIVADLLGLDDTRVPPPVTDPLPRYRAVHDLIASGRVRAAHDVSDGGIAVALAEMAIGGQLGLRATIPADAAEPGTPGGSPSGAGGNGSEASGGARPGLVAVLANEAPGRLLLEAPAAERAAVAARLGTLGRRIGSVTGSDQIEIHVAAGPAGGSSPATAGPGHLKVTLAAARSAFGCHESSP